MTDITISQIVEPIVARLVAEALNQGRPARVMSVAQAADMLGMSRRTAYDRIKQGRLAAVRDEGGIRVTSEAVQAYVRALPAVTKAKAPPRRSPSQKPVSGLVDGW